MHKTRYGMPPTYLYLPHTNVSQVKQMDFLHWQSSLVYRAALESRITSDQQTGQGIGYHALGAYSGDLRRENPAIFRQLNASSFQHLLR
jgi:hypothetical protein